MKQLVIPAWKEDFPGDIDRLVAAAAAYGYEVGRTAAAWAWAEHSDAFCAGWLMMNDYSDEQLLGVLLSYLHCENEENWT